MQRNLIEAVLGAVVLLVAAFFLSFAYTSSDVRPSGGYDITARFSAVNGLKTGSDIRISGVKVGTVKDLALDPKTFLAQATLNLNKTVELSSDSVAIVASDGLLGDKYIEVQPGNEDDVIKPGGRITRTQASASLEQLIGQLVFSAGKDKGGDAAPAPQPSAAAPAPVAPPMASPEEADHP